MQVEMLAIKTSKQSNGGAASKSPKAGMFDEALKSCENNLAKRDDDDSDDNAPIAQLMAAYVAVAPQVSAGDNAQAGLASQQNAEDAAAGEAVSAAQTADDTALFGLMQYPQVGLQMTDAAPQQSVEVPADTLPQADAESVQSQNEILGGFASVSGTAQDAAQDPQIDSFSAQIRRFSNVEQSNAGRFPAAEQQAAMPKDELTFRQEPALSNLQTQNNTADTVMAEIDALSSLSGQSTASASMTTDADFSLQLQSAENNATPNAADVPQTREFELDTAKGYSQPLDSVKARSEPSDALENTQEPAMQVKTSDSAASGKAEQSKQSPGQESGEDKTSKDESGFDLSRLVSSCSQPTELREAQSAEQTARAEVMSQVSDAVKRAAENGRTEIRIRLSPEELGGISIKIVSQNGQLTLQITADNQKTGQLLASGMHELTQSLQDQGITMTKAEVTYSNANSFDAATSQQQQNQGQQSADYSLPKWTVAMETGGTVTVPDVLQPKAVETEDASETSILSILA